MPAVVGAEARSGLVAGLADLRIQLALWTLAAMLLGTQGHLRERLVFHHESAWLRHVLYWLPLCWFWPAVAPLILRLAQHFPLRRQWLRDLVVHGLAAVTLATVHLALDALWFPIVRPFYLPELSFGAFMRRQAGTEELHLNLLVYGALFAFSRAVSGYHRYRERDVRASRLASWLAAARLRALRAQLHPHFLFNVLNSVSTLILRRDGQAAVMLERLDAFLGMVLEDQGEQEIPLRRELAFAQKYLEIERVRFAERLRLEEEIDPATLDFLVPNLLLQPIIENAVRHGIAPKLAGGVIRLRTETRGERLWIRVTDDGVGSDGEGDSAIGTGVGLRNTRERLQQLYGGDGHLHLASQNGMGFAVTLALPLRQAC